MSERRRFSGRERTALFLAADGSCSGCGAGLEPGWHADHVQPWSKYGETDVSNGQALCPPCNLRKGDNVNELRPWQARALDKLLAKGGDFLAVATPGAGKTTFAVTAALRLMERGEITRVIVVVPTAHLRTQWAGAAARLGLDLDHRFVNGDGATAADFVGPVVTYAAVASAPLLFRKLATDRQTLVILDEVHHGGDELTWGNALHEAFSVAARRLLLSGTPRRSDKKPVPFVQYDNAGNFLWDFKYDYGEALLDRTVVRAIEFLALDGEVRWRDAGSVVSTALADANDDTLANALRSALNPDGEWIASVLRRADDELTRHRSEVPDAGGLVIAADQGKAIRYAKMLERICGEVPTVAISDEPDSSARITQFARSKSRWIVAVQMVSEGVDIPRLAVGVYASRIRTDLFFRQVVGRFVRARSTEDVTTSTLLIPSIEPLLRYAQEIETTVTVALAQEEQDVRREIKDQELGQQFLDLVEPLDSSEATHHSTILAGETFTDDELRRAESMMTAAGMPGSVTVAAVARLLRMAGAGRVVGTAVISTAKPVERPLADQKATLRRLINTKVGRLNRITEEPHAHIHGDLNRACGDKAPTATLDSLNHRLTLLDQWIEQARA